MTGDQVCSRRKLFGGLFRNGTEGKSPLLAKDARNGAPWVQHNPTKYGTLLERFDRGSFVVFHVEDGVKLGDLQQVVHLLGEVQQLEFATLILGRGEGADQLADSRAVNIVDVLQIQDNLFVAFAQHLAHRV